MKLEDLFESELQGNFRIGLIEGDSDVRTVFEESGEFITEEDVEQYLDYEVRYIYATPTTAYGKPDAVVVVEIEQPE